jgi:hypothetical protein
MTTEGRPLLSSEKIQVVGENIRNFKERVVPLPPPNENIDLVLSHHNKPIPKELLQNTEIFFFELSGYILSGKSVYDTYIDMRTVPSHKNIDWKKVKRMYFVETEKDYAIAKIQDQEVREILRATYRHNEILESALLTGNIVNFFVLLGFSMYHKINRRQFTFGLLGTAFASSIPYLGLSKDPDKELKRNAEVLIKFRNYILALKTAFINQKLKQEGVTSKAKMIVGELHEEVLEIFKIPQEEKIDFVKDFFESLKEGIQRYYEGQLEESTEYRLADNDTKTSMKKVSEEGVSVAISLVEEYLFKVKGIEEEARTGKLISVIYDIRTNERMITK